MQARAVGGETLGRPRAVAHAERAAGHLLLALLRGDIDEAAGVDVPVWQAVLALARREQVMPRVLLDAGASTHEAPQAVQVRDPIRQELRRARREAAAAAARAYRELAEVLGALRSAGVDAMLLKGAALARFVYAHPALRTFSDLDVLVHPAALRAAVGALRRMGYAAALEAGGHEVSCLDASWRRLPVDVHLGYAERFHGIALDHAQAFARGSRVLVDGEPALLPAPEDALVWTGVNLLRSFWVRQPRLRYLCDAAEVVRRHRVDWDAVARLAGAQPVVGACVRLALHGAVRILGVSVPAAAIAALRPRRAAGLDRWALCRALGAPLDPPWPLEPLLYIALLRWAGGDSARQCARLARARFRAHLAPDRARAGPRAPHAGPWEPRLPTA